MAEEVRWGHWTDFRGQKVTIGEREYAKIGGRLYTREAIEHMVPESYGNSWPTAKAPEWLKPAEGRGITTTVVEHVIENGAIAETQLVKGIERVKKHMDGVSVILENGTVVTVFRESLKI